MKLFKVTSYQDNKQVDFYYINKQNATDKYNACKDNYTYELNLHGVKSDFIIIGIPTMLTCYDHEPLPHNIVVTMEFLETND